MKIVVVTGSPHKEGTSALLADRFIEGAQSVGHTVYRFNVAFEDIHPCLGCDRCGMDGDCIQNDAIQQKLMPQLLQADLIVLATPVYFFAMTAQIKTIVDRFYSRTGRLHHKKSVLLVTAGSNTDLTMMAITDHYNTLVGYMEWDDVGRVLAPGCLTREQIEKTDFPNKAYALGASL